MFCLISCKVIQKLENIEQAAVIKTNTNEPNTGIGNQTPELLKREMHTAFSVPLLAKACKHTDVPIVKYVLRAQGVNDPALDSALKMPIVICGQLNNYCNEADN